MVSTSKFISIVIKLKALKDCAYDVTYYPKMQGFVYSLLKDFDGAGDALAGEISKSIKAMLLHRRLNGEENHTYGEIVSYLKFLVDIARRHESPGGRGYLKWVKLFFKGELPVT